MALACNLQAMDHAKMIAYTYAFLVIQHNMGYHWQEKEAWKSGIVFW